MSRPRRVILCLLAVVALELAPLLCAPDAGSAPAPKVPQTLVATLASSKTSYASGEPVVLTLTLTNTSAGPLVVSSFALGNVGVRSLSRRRTLQNGRTSFSKVKAEQRWAFSLEEAPSAQRHSLTTLAAGTSVSLVVTTIPLPRTDSPALTDPAFETLTLKPPLHWPLRMKFYRLNVSGIYDVQLFYHYQWPDALNAVRPYGRVRVTNTVTFSVG